MKKLIVLALLALGVSVAAIRVDNMPLPECNPCPMVR
jgi:hypothetical protein